MEQRVREYIVELAKSLAGTPYVWGGDKPYDGLDCSGLVIFTFKVFDLLPDVGDWTAQGLSGMWERTTTLNIGDLIFYGENDHSISHVAIYIGNNNAISARGAGRNATRETSLKSGASVKPHTVQYRRDLRFFVDISKPL